MNSSIQNVTNPEYHTANIFNQIEGQYTSSVSYTQNFGHSPVSCKTKNSEFTKS